MNAGTINMYIYSITLLNVKSISKLLLFLVIFNIRSYYNGNTLAVERFENNLYIKNKWR